MTRDPTDERFEHGDCRYQQRSEERAVEYVFATWLKGRRLLSQKIYIWSCIRWMAYSFKVPLGNFCAY
jgi:hypothetical protein